MAKRDYYEVLGINKGATDDEIKKAYRKVAMANHPDTHPNDKDAEERFKEASEAYEVLSDPKKKAAYDQYGFAGVDGMGGAGSGYQNVYRDFSDIFGGSGGFSDIFSSFFGGGGSQRRNSNSPQQGQYIYSATHRNEQVYSPPSLIRLQVCYINLNIHHFYRRCISVDI